MQPETREVLQCLYAPRSASEDERPAPKPEGLGDAFSKFTILSAVLDRPIDPEVLHRAAMEAKVGEGVADAATAFADGRNEEAASLLANTDLHRIADFARAIAAASDPSPKGKKSSAPSQAEAGGGAKGPLDFLRNLGKSPAPTRVADVGQFVLRGPDLIEALVRAAEVDPIGFLHLERLHFTPVGKRRGDLVYSVTMMPGETVRLTHREWSRTEQEYTSLVSTSMETEQENSLSEKSELTESTSVQQNHSMAFTSSLNASGQFGVVHIAANAGLSISNQVSNTRETSVKRTRDFTRKASSRAKQEHKVTFRTLNVAEREDTNYRELTNQSEEAQRWDFHRIMREWEVKLYRYDLRLTYDITVPEPGAYLLRLYKRREAIREAMARPPRLPTIAEVRPENYSALVATYNVAVEPPPVARTITGTNIVECASNEDHSVAAALELTIPDGYQLTTPVEFDKVEGGHSATRLSSRTSDRKSTNEWYIVREAITGSYSWPYSVAWFDFPKTGMKAVATLHAMIRPTDAAITAWQAGAHAAMAEALQARHEEQIAALKRQAEDIDVEIGAIDTLSLRRLEREELMKSVLRWILGPSLQFRSDLFDDEGDESDLPLSDGGRKQALRHGRLISFIHQAVEWENVSFILYPYFWSDDWDFKQRMQHPDDAYCQFLRAGAARVVLPIRRGFEAAWLHFASTGQLAAAGEAAPPYRAIAEEIRAGHAEYQRAAGGEGSSETGLLIGEWKEWTPTGAMEVVEGAPLAP